jgi:hypothetical protein
MAILRSKSIARLMARNGARGIASPFYVDRLIAAVGSMNDHVKAIVSERQLF